MVRYAALKGLYEVEKTIGCGGFAKVKLATHIATGEKVAIKIMDKSLLGDDLPRVKLELKALKSMSHEHICKLYQVIETETHFFIVIEYCSGGELFDHIVEKNRLSESESRVFFRQIVSAVAYLHSLGYAHRDLKPENVLLDKYQNLKLIDFGLCARPEGGMENPLFTSCGSPTYAAPELVLGKQYLGQEVDVWAMGVLLYALLAGSLPFDDLNIDSLYKKILSGKYDEPSFMSKESKQLIKSMLQVNPKRRITINELLSHRWITLGILDPVEVRSEYSKAFDKECVEAMAKYYQVDSEVMWSYLKKWKYDYHTATYFLLLYRKKRGAGIKLNNTYLKMIMKEKHDGTPVKVKQNYLEINFKSTPNNKTFRAVPIIITNTPDKKCDIEINPVTPKFDVISPREFVEPKRPSSAIRKPLKRIRSPTLDVDGSPIPAKKATPGQSTPLKTPDQKRTPVNSESAGSARRVLGSLERSLHRVRHVLTPKKTTVEGSAASATQPASLANKDLCNVSTTQCKDPEFVVNELSKALEQKGITCNRKGFTLRGKFEPTSTRRFGGCSFELEICLLPSIVKNEDKNNEGVTPTRSILKKGTLNYDAPNSDTQSIISSQKELPYVGIRRKRLKGDSWCYKKVCEQVLALTATDLKPDIKFRTESSV